MANPAQQYLSIKTKRRFKYTSPYPHIVTSPYPHISPSPHKSIAMRFFQSVLLTFAAIGIYAVFTNGSIYLNPAGERLNDESPIAIAKQLPIPASITLFGETVPLNDPDVRERLDYELNLIVYSKQYQTIDIMKSMHRFFPYMDQVLQQNGVPTDFKYLAVAESSLESTATSPKGAKGVWQFMEATAKEFNLEMNDEVDERSHTEKATEAASKYLKNAFRKFNNWTLAAASYNCGMTGLQNQIDAQQEWNYYNLFLNPETARYIYRIIAYKQVLENPGLYGYKFSMPDRYNNYNLRETMVTSAGDLPTFARTNGTNYKMLRTLNPWLRKNSLIGNGSKAYIIKLPN